MIRAASQSDIPALRNIWQICFGDSEQYLDLYFNNCFNLGNTYAYIYKDEIISMLTILPTMQGESKCFRKLGYIYAAATHPDYQGHGIMANMLKYAKELARASGWLGLCLVPGSKELFSYYENHDFSAVYYHSVGEYALQPSADQFDELRSIGANEYISCRDSFSYNYNFLRFSRKLDAYIGKELEFTGHSFLQGDGFCACIREQDGKVYVRELIYADNDKMNLALKSISLAHKSNLNVRLPFNAQLSGLNLSPYAMTWFVNKEDLAVINGYANLLLD